MNHDLKEICTRYLAMADSAIEKVREYGPKDSFIETISRDYMKMITGYISDAHFFFEKGDYVRCLSAVNYAYGWIDAGARFGILDVQGDHVNFTLFK
ncbi:MAG: DUF357 domain-containing protein [Candidatus Thermoplasmatota archaeon]|nr:DUF357 domain-containing protein [Candidatus Thermoplasmatota archaeon]MCL5731140.1 DUF357 domain-containing protein [Candidatus Thermoplasmatota archaeon]